MSAWKELQLARKNGISGDELEEYERAWAQEARTEWSGLFERDTPAEPEGESDDQRRVHPQNV